MRGIAPEAMSLLLAYSWPGNVRELQSVIKQALVHTVGPVLRADALPEEIHRKDSPACAPRERRDGRRPGQFIRRRLVATSHNLYAEVLELMEQHLLAHVLQHTHGNQSRAAELLGITRGSLRHKIPALGIGIDQVVNVSGNGAAADSSDSEEPENDPDQEF